jgi:heme/copper-type cytochrome/quinol oxidase subunit 3
MTSSVDNHAGEHAEGVHLPKPSITPLVFGLGFFLLVFGLILANRPGDDTQPILYLVSAAGLAVMLIAVGGWLWGNIRERAHGTETPMVAAKFAMWCFLGTEIIIFGALIGRVLGLWIADPTANDLLTHPIFPSLVLVSVNTFILLVSSLFVVLGLAAIQEGNPRRLFTWLALTALLGASFVGVQAYEYSKLVHEGFVFGESQFASALYFLTGNHGLHVIIGVIWAIVVCVNALRGSYTAQEHLGVEIFGLYWHFVDVVWIIIFTLVYLV